MALAALSSVPTTLSAFHSRLVMGGPYTPPKQLSGIYPDLESAKRKVPGLRSDFFTLLEASARDTAQGGFRAIKDLYQQSEQLFLDMLRLVRGAKREQWAEPLYTTKTVMMGAGLTHMTLEPYVYTKPIVAGTGLAHMALGSHHFAQGGHTKLAQLHQTTYDRWVTALKQSDISADSARRLLSVLGPDATSTLAVNWSIVDREVTIFEMLYRVKVANEILSGKNIAEGIWNTTDVSDFSSLSQQYRNEFGVY